MRFDLNDAAWRFDAPPGAGVARHAREDGMLVLEGNGTGACFGRWIGPRTPVTAGQAYAIAVEGRIDGVPSRELRVHVHALVNWVAQDGNVVTRDYIDQYCADGSAPLMSNLLDAPANAVGAYLEMAIKWPGTGRAAFTGASIEAAERPPVKKVRLAAAFTSFPGNKQGNLEALLQAIDNAARERPDLLCLGETALRYGLTVEQAAVDMDGPEVAALRERAKRHVMIIVVGLTERDGPLFFNCALVIGSDGGVIGKYRKVNLPLAEIEEGYSPGFDYPVFNTPIGKVGVLICWDMTFPEPARILVDKGADILCAPSYWYSDLQTPARAADNGVFLVVSAPRDSKEPCRVIDPKGRVVAQCVGGEEYERGVCVAEVDVRQRHYIYWHSVGPSFGDHKSIMHQERREDTYTFHNIEATNPYDSCPRA